MILINRTGLIKPHKHNNGFVLSNKAVQENREWSIRLGLDFKFNDLLSQGFLPQHVSWRRIPRGNKPDHKGFIVLEPETFRDRKTILLIDAFARIDHKQKLKIDMQATSARVLEKIITANGTCMVAELEAGQQVVSNVHQGKRFVRYNLDGELKAHTVPEPS